MRNPILFAGAAVAFGVPVLAAPPTNAAPETIPVAAFSRFAEFTDVKISPAGEYLAVGALLGNQLAVLIMQSGDKKVTATLRMGDDQSVDDYWWVGPDRVAASIDTSFGALGLPAYTGEIVGMNADGRAQSYIYGYREEKHDVDTRLRTRENAKGWGYMVDPTPADPTSALIKVEYFNEARGTGAYDLGGTAELKGTGFGYSSVLRIDTWNGRQSKAADSPYKGKTEYLADHTGRIRYATGTDIQGEPQTWYRESEDDPWRQLNTAALAKAHIVPLGFAADDREVYLDSDEGQDRRCLVAHVLATNEHRPLICSPSGDLERVIYSFDASRRPIAAVFADQDAEIVYVDPGSADASLLGAIVRSFPGQAVVPVSQTLDGSKVVLLVHSDRNPGDYFLFDTKAKKAQYLLSRRAWIDPAQQPERRPIALTGRSGVPLRGFLTIPAGRKPEHLPLVVNPHAGPFDAHDGWDWDSEAALLASRGFATLQINFRGSTGYGASFRAAGRQALGTALIDDLTDGVKWAVAQGYVDPRRICIYGADYGGFAALASAAREPELYRCAAGYGSFYDLKALEGVYRARNGPSGLGWFHEMIGDKPEELWAQSPMAQLDHLRAAVLIAHGKEDTDAPIAQAEALRDELARRHVPVEWIAKSGELHGFAAPQNREEFYGRLVAFIDRWIGAGAAAPAAGGDSPKP